MNYYYQIWLKACCDNNISVYTLEEKEDNAIYKLMKEGENPVYIVWIDGIKVLTTNSMLSAYKRYKEDTDGNNE